MKVNQVINCSFDRWYNLFKHVTFKSEIIPIPDDVLEYFRSDSSIILPKSCQEELDFEQKLRKEEKKRNYEDSDDSWDEEDEEEDENKNKLDFPEFDKMIKNALERFSNKVFIKLNWSSPKDAYWVLSKLSCDRLSDVYIQLKSSDFVSHDLNQAFESCTDLDEMSQSLKEFKYNLVIREWISINPAMEFRCFVNKNKLVGISQRDCRSFYQILLDNKDSILSRIETFYAENIHSKFLDDCYVFDVCLGKNKVKLLDFNPFGSLTDSLLYSWDELCDESLLFGEDNLKNHFKSSKLEIRIVESNIGVQSNQYVMYSQPRDALDINELDSNSIANLPSIIEKNIEFQAREDFDSSI